MSKTRIIIKFKNAYWRIGSSRGCASKRDCDLFKKGVCNSEGYVEKLPCDKIEDVFIQACGSCPKYCFKKIRKTK